MIKSLQIENFRGFKKSEVAGLSRVNIIVGDNSSGKTAFLEAIFLATSSNPQAALTLRQWRGLEATMATTSTDLFDSLWTNLFNNFDRNNVINIRLTGSDNDSRSLSIFNSKASAITLPLPPNSSELQPQANIYTPVSFEWIAGGKTSTVHLRPGPAGIQQEGVLLESNFRAAFIPAHAQTSHQYSATLFSNLSKENKEDQFVGALQRQFPSIQKVSVEVEAGAHAIFVSVPWLKSKMPLALYSNAANNLSSIVLNIAGSPKGIVSVDEMENGFHYSRYGLVWDQVYDFAKAYETQVFASTHSEECIRAAAEVMKKNPSDFTVIQVFHKDGVSDAVVVPAKDALAAIENDIEIRGS